MMAYPDPGPVRHTPRRRPVPIPGLPTDWRQRPEYTTVTALDYPRDVRGQVVHSYPVAGTNYRTFIIKEDV